MRLCFWAGTALLATSGSALAQSLEVKVDNFGTSNGISTAVFRVANNGQTDAKNVRVQCVFFDKEKKAVDIGLAVLDFIPKGTTAYGKTMVASQGREDTVGCGPLSAVFE